MRGLNVVGLAGFGRDFDRHRVRWFFGLLEFKRNGYDEDYKYWPGKPRRHHLFEYVSHIQRSSMSLVSKSSIPYLCQTAYSYCSLTHRAFVLIDVSPASPFNHDHAHAS